MRVLLVQPWVHDFAAFDLWMRPLAWLQLAARLLHCGVEVDLVDALDRFQEAATDLPVRHHRDEHFGCGHYFQEEIEKPSLLRWVPRRYKRFGLPPEQLRQVLSSRARPDLVLTGCTMTYWYPGLFETIREIRSLWPTVPIGVAGIYAVLCPEHLRQAGVADFVYSGNDYDELAQLIGRQLGQDVSSGAVEADCFVAPAYSLLSQQKSLPLLTSSGCVFDCSYCASRRLAPTFRQFPAQALLELMENCSRRYQTRDWAFYDDALLVRKEQHFMPLMEAVAKRGYRFRFHTPNALHAEPLDRRVAELLRAAGFETIRLGLEFGRKDRQQETGGKLTWRDYRLAMRNLHLAGFSAEQLGTYVMAAYPGQSPPEVLETCRRVHEQGSLIKLALYAPIPGTRDFERDCADWRFHPVEDPLYHNPSLAPYRSRSFPFEEYQALKQRVNAWNQALAGSPRPVEGPAER